MGKRSRRHKHQPANTLASVGSKSPLLNFNFKSPSTTPQTAEVLSLAELEKDPATRDKYISTLPYFDRNWWVTKDTAPCECTYAAKCESPFGCKGCKARDAFARRQAKAIKTTAKRWVWFTDARKVNDEHGERLGTLVYLPLEIRQKIFEIIYEDNYYQAIYHEHHTGRKFKGPEFDGRDPHSGLWGINGLRLASPSTKTEVDYLYLSKTPFEFDCPSRFTKFLERLSTTQHNQLRSITFLLFHYCYSRDHLNRNVMREILYDHRHEDRKELDWIALFAKLPPGLTSLKFELGTPPWPLDPRRPLLSSWHDLMRGNKSFHHLLGLLIGLSKQARRRSPGVHLECSTKRTDYCSFVPPGSSQDYLEMLDDVCKDPDEWSEEWLDGCEEVHEGCEMVVNWRRLRQDRNAMPPARPQIAGG